MPADGGHRRRVRKVHGPSTKAAGAPRGSCQRVHRSALLAVTLLLTASIDRGTAQTDVATKLNHEAEHLARQQYTPLGLSTLAAVRHGQHKSIEILLLAGAANAVVAVCDNCNQLDMTLFDHQRRLVTRSPDRSDAVIISGNPAYSGRHEVEIGVPGCHASQCDVGVLVLRKEPEPNSVAAPFDPLIREALKRLHNLGLTKAGDKVKRGPEASSLNVTREGSQFTVSATRGAATIYEMRDAAGAVLASVNLLEPRYDTPPSSGGVANPAATADCFIFNGKKFCE